MNEVRKAARYCLINLYLLYLLEVRYIVAIVLAIAMIVGEMKILNPSLMEGALLSVSTLGTCLLAADPR